MFRRAYQPNRTAFMDVVKTLQGKPHLKVKVDGYSLGLRGPEREELRTDCCLISHSNSVTPDSKLLLVTTGVHGCELYAGSAVVRNFLSILGTTPSLLPAHTSLAVVHAVNPFGSAWIRRENSNNVDLNRNFLPDIAKKVKEELNDKVRFDFYKRNGHLLDCSKPVSLRLLRILGMSLRYGEKYGTKMLLPGQRQYPGMMFYGGNTLQDEVTKLCALANSFLLPQGHGYKEVVHLDLHTGIGPWGKSTIIAGSEEHLLPIKSRSDVFRHVLGLNNFPKIDGDLMSNLPGFLQHISGVEWKGLIEEYGTYGKTKLFFRHVPEHVHYHLNSSWLQPYIRLQSSTFDSNYLSAKPKLALIDAFCPNNSIWEKSVLATGFETINSLLKYLG